MLKEEIIILEFTKDSFVAEDGKTIEFAYVLARLGGKVVKIKVDRKLDLSPYLDRECTAKMEIRPDAKLYATLRIVEVL